MALEALLQLENDLPHFGDGESLFTGIRPASSSFSWEVGQERYGSILNDDRTETIDGKEVQIRRNDRGLYIVTIEGIPFEGMSFDSESDALIFARKEIMERYGLGK